jgi:transposase
MAYGYPTDLWTCSRIAAVIEKEFAISYHPAHLSRILRSMGYSP